MSGAPNDGGPAFPCKGPPMYVSDGKSAPEMIRGSEANLPGMSLRDYFAGQALAGWLASFGPDTPHPAYMNDAEQACANVARFSYVLADAMLAARGGA